VAEYVSQSPYDALLRIDQPGPGVAALGAFSFPGGQSMVALSFYHYGDQAAETVARVTPLWQAWVQDRFPTPAEPGKCDLSSATPAVISSDSGVHSASQQPPE